MKKVILNIYLVLSLFLLCGSAWAQAESYGDIEVLSLDENGITFSYRVPELKIRKLNLDKGSFDLVDIDGCIVSQEPGNPRLPIKIVALAVPLESQIEVLVSDIETTRRSLDIAPVPDIEKDENIKLGYKYIYSPSSKVYSKDSFFPEEMVKAEPTMFLRNQRIVKLQIYPIQFNPQQKIAQVYNNITVRVNFIGGNKSKIKTASRDLFEKIYKKTLLNYEQGRSWRRTRTEKALFKPKDNPFDYSDDWYKIKVSEDGVYCLTRADLSNAGITGNIDTAEIRIFNGGGRALPLSNDSAYLELKEIPLWIKDNNGNEYFDSNDSLFFYGWSCSGFDYDTSKREFVYQYHPYDSYNVFWLNVEGGFPNPAKRMEIKDGNLNASPPPVVANQTKSREHIESNSILKTGDRGLKYHIWYWTKVSSFSPSRFLPDLVDTETHKINVKASASVLSLFVNGSEADMVGSELSEDDAITKFESNAFTTDDNLQNLNIIFPTSIYFDWYEIEYKRWLRLFNNHLLFESPDAIEDTIEYHIANISSSSIYLFDISDRFEVKRFKDLEFSLNSDTAKFQDALSLDEKLQYYALKSNRLKKPESIYQDEHSNWRNASHQADMIIITPEVFFNQSSLLADFRRSYSQLSVETVELQDIYDEFSGGLIDPLAIRNFLKHTFNNWTQREPAFVLLVGDGHFDHKGYWGTNLPIHIPCFTAYITPVTDEYYVYFGNFGDLDSDDDSEVDMVISRLPVNSNNELEGVLQKIIDYEEDPSFGTWRNKITLVADDEFHNDGNNELFHTGNSETLSESYIPQVFDISKIYMVEYPFNSVGQKPGVTDAIIDAFDGGCLIMNYIGHGNPDLWADEYVLMAGRDIPKLSSNNKKLPLVFAASCEVGYFMSPTKQSLGEQLLTTKSKGASGVIASSYKVGSGSNFALNIKFYQELFSEENFSIGEALFVAKFLCTFHRDYHSYVLFGDPVSKLGLPRLLVSMEVDRDTLSALSLASINGQVLDSLGNPKPDFNGAVNISAFDSKREKSYEVAGVGIINYKLSGRTLFRGTAQVENGSFGVQFVVPKDISYGGNTARVRAYVYNQDIDGVGTIESLVVCGSDTTVIDNQGPEIRINFPGQESFKEGDFIPPNTTMELTISDTNGINLTGEIGHGITLSLDDEPGETDLTHLFGYNAGSYTTGSLSYQLPALSEGEHTFKLKAWDSANNSTQLITKAKIRSSAKFEILNLMNYPNPFSELTNFSYELTDDASNVEIKIFTLAGRLIKTIRGASNTVGYNFRTTWDGRDEDGDKIANGVYIYKVEATSVSGIKAEALGKAIVMH